MYVGDYSPEATYHALSILMIASILLVILLYDLEVPIFWSRAGYKLEAAIEQLGIDVSGKVALDSGLSTGGFTDCLLQYGASFVYGVDVGYGQVT